MNAAPITVIVNGVPRELPVGSTVASLLAELGAPEQGVAVAVDAEVVPRAHHAETTLTAGAHIEVIRAVGGG